MTNLKICDLTKRKPIIALKPGTFFVLHKDSNLKDVICIKLDDYKRFFDFDESCIHSYGDVDCTASVLLCKSVDIYVKNEQNDQYYENFALHYPKILNHHTVALSYSYTVSNTNLMVGNFFTSVYHPINISKPLPCDDDHFYLKVSDSEYFDLVDCTVHPINDTESTRYVNKLDNVEISVSI